MTIKRVRLEAVAISDESVGQTREHVGHRPTFRISSSNQFSTTTISFCAPALALPVTK